MFDFDERHKGGENVILVNVEFTNESSNEDLNELKMLAESAGGNIVHILSCARKLPDSRFFIGSGKTEELKQLVASIGADTVIFNHELSPSQERNLELEINCKVIARTSLILDIFAQRARTKEGKLQVELAQLGYLQTRLVRGWTHLERQKGGIGMRGPGETQLESDRRMLKDRISALRRELEEVEKQREQGGKARKKNDIPIISLVGYTNAGKSTLFNKLTDSTVYAANQLFATLDPTLRTVEIPLVGKVVFADTVGFIRHLPHDLVAAFKATLRETRMADLQLHVIDSADERMTENINSVDQVLEDIEANDITQIKVYNKIDKIPGIEPHIVHGLGNKPEAVSISSQTGLGIDLLYKAIAAVLSDDIVSFTVKLPPSEGALRTALYELNAVVSENYSQIGESILELKYKRVDLAKVNSKFNNKLQVYTIKPKNFLLVEKSEY